MPSKKTLSSSQRQTKSEQVKLHDRIEISVPPDFPFSSISCRNEYADVFSQLFEQLLTKGKEFSK